MEHGGGQDVRTAREWKRTLRSELAELMNIRRWSDVLAYQTEMGLTSIGETAAYIAASINREVLVGIVRLVLVDLREGR